MPPKNKNSKKSNNIAVNDVPDVYAIYASLSFAVVIILIGIPMWWKTTEVYRVPLPYAQVESLLKKTINHAIPVTIVLEDTTVVRGKLWEGIYSLSSLDLDSNGLEFTYHWAIRELMLEEEDAFATSQSISELDRRIHDLSKIQEMPIGSVHIFILSSNNKLPRSTVNIGTQRIAFVNNDGDFNALVYRIVSTVKNSIVKQHILQKVFLPPLYRQRTQPEKEVMRPLGAVPVLDVVFTLIVSQPHMIDVSWDMETAEKYYLKPLIEKLLPLTEVNIKSQVLYMIAMNIRSKFNNHTKENYIEVSQLPQIINPFESKLGMQVSVNPTLNFVIYIPTVSQVPLHIYQDDGVKVSSNSFLSPRWGGLIIQNPKEVDINEKIKMTIDMKNVMSLFISQMKLLIGFPETNEKDGKVQFLSSPVGTDVELDFFLRRRTQEQLSTSISSLTSLTELLGTISNIVITDDIGDKINTAVQSIEGSLEDLKNGELLAACKKAKQAFVLSEEAFFDQSLLAMLYFPNDQKYAVYIPLFLPVSLPVVMSFKQFWAYFRRSRRHEKSD